MGLFRRIRRIKDTNIIPLAIAVQALALFVTALFVNPSMTTSHEPTGVGSDAANTSDSLTSLSELPTDLRRQRLPVPRVPERENESDTRQPTPANDGDKALQSQGSKLASLRTQSVALSGVVAIPIAAPMLGVPDSLDGLSLAGGGAWHGGATQSARNRGREGGTGLGPIGGGPGMIGGGGGGGGGGGYCPTPGRVGRR